MAEGRIGLRSALKALADRLRVEGVRRAPTDLTSSGEVVVVHELLPPPQGAYDYQLTSGGSVHSLSLLSNITLAIGDRLNGRLIPDTGDPANPFDTATRESRLLLGSAALHVTASDVDVFATADAEMLMQWILVMDTSAESLVCPLVTHRRIAFRTYSPTPTDVDINFNIYGGTNGTNLKANISASNQTPDSAYHPGLGSPLWIPRGMALGFEMSIGIGVTFGAGSTLRVCGMAAQGVPTVDAGSVGGVVGMSRGYVPPV